MAASVQLLKLPYKGHNIADGIGDKPPGVWLEESHHPAEEVKYCDINKAEGKEKDHVAPL